MREGNVKLPQFSLGSVAFMILVLAVNLAVLRVAYDEPAWSGRIVPAVYLLPMVDLCLFAVFRLRHRCYCTPRPVGFLIAGGLATAVTHAVWVVAPMKMRTIRVVAIAGAATCFLVIGGRH